jgi:hypothetical protein
MGNRADHVDRAMTMLQHPHPMHQRRLSMHALPALVAILVACLASGPAMRRRKRH